MFILLQFNVGQSHRLTDAKEQHTDKRQRCRNDEDEHEYNRSEQVFHGIPFSPYVSDRSDKLKIDFQ